ncbi:hypothetical protein B0H10DRAFT_2234991 [Mycena sp. CBHHK59/15]|nr:hypothetical protein B0H10DRAFT_2234991 [Mycena sp. CBHHK59/15]
MDGADDFDFFYNDLNFDEDDSMEHVDDERDDCGRDLSDDEGAEKQDPIQLYGCNPTAKLVRIGFAKFVRIGTGP